jgi:hypothetical protein
MPLTLTFVLTTLGATGATGASGTPYDLALDLDLGVDNLDNLDNLEYLARPRKTLTLVLTCGGWANKGRSGRSLRAKAGRL